MRVLSSTWETVRHALGVTAQAALIGAIAVTLVFGAAVVSRHDPAGAAAVYAARGGNGGGNGHGGSGAAPIAGGCYVNGPVSLFSDYTIHGWGLAPDEALAVVVQDPAATSGFWATTDSVGSVSAVAVAWHAGTSTVSFYDQTSGRDVLVASCSFTVN